MVDLCSAFASAGVFPLVIVDHPPLDRLETLRRQGFEPIVLDPEGTTTVPEYAARLRKCLTHADIRFVHSHAWERKLTIGSTIKSLGIDVVETLHCTVRGGALWLWRNVYCLTRGPLRAYRARKQFNATNPAVICISDRSLANFSKLWPRIRRRKRIYCGTQVPEEAADVAAAPEGINVVWIGSMIERKRPLWGLRLWEDVCRQFPEARLTMAGAGPELDAVRRTASNKRNVAIPGNVSDVRPLLRNAHIMLHTSSDEGIPLTIINALNFGIPVVSTDVGAIREAVVHGHNGFLADKDDLPGLGRHLTALMKDKSLRASMGKCARARGEKLFNIEVCVREVARAYNEFVGVYLEM